MTITATPILEATTIKLRYHHPKHDPLVKVSGSQEAYDVLMYNLNDSFELELKEYMWVMYLNRRNHVLGIYHHSTGSSTQTIVCAKEITTVALLSNAHAVVLFHNHPSCNVKPSLIDIEITKKVKDALTYFDIALLDHLIITCDTYYSFADNEIL